MKFNFALLQWIFGRLFSTSFATRRTTILPRKWLWKCRRVPNSVQHLMHAWTDFVKVSLQVHLKIWKEVMQVKKRSQKLKERIKNRLDQAYGLDEIVFELVAIGLFFILLDIFTNLAYISYFSIIFLLLGCFRCYSANIEARKEELRIYENFKSDCAEWLNKQQENLKDKITYKYVKCPHCGTVIKLPRRLGEITVTCPKCNNKFNKNV